MTTALYDATIPNFVRAMENLSKILDKGRAFADENGLDHAELLEARLIEDMGSLTMQIQRLSDTAKGVAVRIGEAENAVFADEETSFDDLQQRLRKTIDFVKAVPEDAFAGRDDAEVTVKTGRGDLVMNGRNFIYGFAVPNFYFHVTTAYDILRMKGVPLEKLDYLGAAR